MGVPHGNPSSVGSSTFDSAVPAIQMCFAGCACQQSEGTFSDETPDVQKIVKRPFGWNYSLPPFYVLSARPAAKVGTGVVPRDGFEREVRVYIAMSSSPA